MRPAADRDPECSGSAARRAVVEFAGGRYDAVSYSKRFHFDFDLI
jgi:hypothetical protein